MYIRNDYYKLNIMFFRSLIPAIAHHFYARAHTKVTFSVDEPLEIYILKLKDLSRKSS